MDQSQIPNVRGIANSAQVPLIPATITVNGANFQYPGCVALIPDSTTAGQWDVALYVSGSLTNTLGSTGVSWAPPANTVVVDLPLGLGFAFQSASGLLWWLQQTPPAGAGGLVNVTAVAVGGDPTVPTPNPGSVAQPKDIPHLRPPATSVVPLNGYVACIVLAQDPDPANPEQYHLVLYVDQSLQAAGGVTWPANLPLANSWIMDLPRGFSVNNSAGLMYWFNRLLAALTGGGPATGVPGPKD